jgi:hypothetical protein
MIRHATASTFTPDPPAPARGPLPVYLASFVGREAELDAVAALLDAVRLVTLTGPAGVGKTRLAVGVAAARQARYRDGASFVPLAPVADPGLVVQAFAQTLDVLPVAGRAVGSPCMPTWERASCYWCSTTSSTSSRPRPTWRPYWRPARTCACWRPAGRR